MVKYTVSVDMKNRPKGDEIEVPPLGVLKNGGAGQTIEFEDEKAGEAFYENAKAASGVNIKKGGGD